MSLEKVSQHIDIPGDKLVPDAEFCDEVLGGATRRTAQKLDALGPPYAIIANKKYRPLNEGRAFVAALIQRKGQPPTRRRVR